MSSIIEIITYQPEHQPWFEKLNRDWIEKYFHMESMDEQVLQHPDEYIIDEGGMIFMALYQKEIAGTVALKLVEPGIYEFTKMGVAEKFRGKKIGEVLSQVAIQYAKERKAKRIILYSNRKLIPAIALYHKLGFTEVAVDGPYERCDIKMELSLSNLKKFKFTGMQPVCGPGRHGVIGLL